jgi:hypothetical protein
MMSDVHSALISTAIHIISTVLLHIVVINLLRDCQRTCRSCPVICGGWAATRARLEV